MIYLFGVIFFCLLFRRIKKKLMFLILNDIFFCWFIIRLKRLRGEFFFGGSKNCNLFKFIKMFY